eukprot:6119474-Prorocentrum_lima.AAC.1
MATSSLAAQTAAVKGVEPLLLTASMTAPRSTSLCTVFRFPIRAWTCRLVSPPLSRAARSALLLSSNLTT